MENTEKIEGLIEKITYKNDTNGWTVCSVRVGNSRVTAVGAMPFLSEGETASFEGRYVVHPTYGEQFSVVSFERKAPKTVGAILRYLSSGIIKGVGPATAEKIVERFKEKTLDIISSDPKQLALIKGISEEKAAAISEEYNKQFGVRDVMMLLSPYEVTPEFCALVFRRLGGDAAEIIKSDPYCLCREEIGFSFEKAEKIAFDFGIEADNELRLAAGVEHILKRNLSNGHTCLPKEKLIAVAVKLLESDYYRIESIIDKMVDSFRLAARTVDSKVFYSIPEYMYAEEHIAARLSAIYKNAEKFSVVTDLEIDYYENKTNKKFEKIQRDAIKQAIENGVFVLTGGPGTGKTTTINAIIGLFEQRGLSISLAAPTGRAAKRMSELTLREAKTLHRLLQVEWDDNERPTFARNERNPLESDVVIVDEVSMVDVLLFESLLKALRPTSRLILVGDAKQLPSVSAGNVLGDIIDSGKFPCVTLKKVFRQAKTSAIISTAHAIIEETPVDFSNKSEDFFFLQKQTASDVVETIHDLCLTRLPERYSFDPLRDIQVICASRMYKTGVTNLNNVLQQALNPKKDNSPEIFNKGVAFRVNDKVMQIKNNYDIPLTGDDGEISSGVFNGDVGFITEIDLKAAVVKVRFDERVATYSLKDMAELELAYAVTVHKSQGSEFPCVIIPTLDIPEKLQYRNLLYTAVTRAKRFLVIVGSKSVFCNMAANDRKTLRYTMLKEFLYER